MTWLTVEMLIMWAVLTLRDKALTHFELQWQRAVDFSWHLTDIGDRLRDKING